MNGNTIAAGCSDMKNQNSFYIEQANSEIKKYGDKVQADPYRLSYHLMPPVGLLNDPNGLIQHNGIYHVFYQWNPFETAHGAKYWGHFTSLDLVHWRAEPPALAPDEWYDRNGCYSGCAVEKDGRLYLFYTGNVKQKDGTRETNQCLAVSDDGIRFEKLGPVLELPEGYTPHFRDPKVWRRGDCWYMVVGAQTKDLKGAAVLFTSRDLFRWEEAGVLAGAGLNGLGDFGYMWECPDLFRLDGMDVLLVSPQGLKPQGNKYRNLFQSGYFAGILDYHNHSYIHGDFAELDRGFDFYAPQTFLDEQGRRILIAWMGMTDEAEAYQPTIAHHWVHALTVPRVLELKDGKLLQRPVKELEKLRKSSGEVHQIKMIDDYQTDYGMKESSAELLLEAIHILGNEFTITFRNEALLCYDAVRKEMSLERRNMKTGMTEKRACTISSLSSLQIFMDRSSLEIFVNDGEEVFTARYFPDPCDFSISFRGHAECKLTKWELGKACGIERKEGHNGRNHLLGGSPD